MFEIGSLVLVSPTHRNTKREYLLRPAHDGEWPQGRREPRIKHVFVLLEEKALSCSQNPGTLCGFFKSTAYDPILAIVNLGMVQSLKTMLRLRIIIHARRSPRLLYGRNMRDSGGPTTTGARCTNLECSPTICTNLLLIARVQS